MADARDVDGWTCPVPLRGHDRIVMGHGGGGKLSSELIEHLFVPAFNDGARIELHDAATVPVATGRLAFATDSYVVRPLFFAGGCIGDLAVNGTVNDLAMSGAQPIAMSAGFILEEGLPMATLAAVVEAMAMAAATAGVQIVTGDTKVVGVGQADGMYVNTAGIGMIPEHVDIRPGRARPGDVVILSGPIGEHGVAVLSTREGFEFGTDVRTDSAALNGLVGDMIAAFADIHVLRDATRGGVTAVLCEIAASAQLGIEFDERAIPIPPAVAAACSFLGLDAMHIANEGKLVAFVPPRGVDDVMDAMHRHDLGREACVIGRVVADHPGTVVARTALGALRVVDVPLGEQLPRIC